MTVTMLPTEVGQMSAVALAEIIERSIAGNPVADYAEREPLAWSVLEDGGWDCIAVPEEFDGGGANLRDLVEVAQVWGAASIPQPLLESIWAKRWSASARERGGPISVSVTRLGGSDSSGLAPFAALAATGIARSIGTGNDEFDVAPLGEPDPFSPALRPSVLPWTTTIETEARRELGVIWAAEVVGAAQKLVDLSVAYAKTREQFGKPIGSFQSIKHRLADMHSKVQYAQTAVIWASLEPMNSQRACTYAVDTAVTLAENSIQIHGGMGFTWEMGLHYYLRTMLTRRQLIDGLWSS
jgi:alkylation response protein AidB-like acyl-CoA dehydrogenase